MKLLFLDTETTGNDLAQDRLCQLCFKNADNLQESLFQPPVPISVKSMSITHITNEMVSGKEAFQNSLMFLKLKELLNDHILVAHNASFDIAMLEAEGLTVPQFICTLRVSRHLDEDDAIPEHKLQYLRYHFDLNVPNAHAHDACGDVLVLEALFRRLAEDLKQKSGLLSDDEVIKSMMEISCRPSFIRKFSFGKYRDSKISDVVQRDPGYLEWLLREKKNDLKKNPGDSQTTDWIYSLNRHLGRSS